MMNVVSWVAAALLGAAAIAEGYYLRARNPGLSAPAEEIQDRPGRMAAELDGRSRGAAPLHQEEEGPLLGNNLEEWFRAREVAAGIRPVVSATDTEISVALKIPGMMPESLKISINDVRVTIFFIVRLVEEKKDAHGSYRREEARQYEMIMPVPANADARKHRLIRDGEAFQIIFEKREDSTLKF